jgi:hypothetical protein
MTVALDLAALTTVIVGGLMGYFTRLIYSDARNSKELSFIKGQLTQIITMLQDIEELKIKHVVLEKDQDKLKSDVKAAHDRIRGIHQNADR